MGAVFKKEIRAYLTTPIAYVYAIVYLAVSGLAFSLLTVQNAINAADADYSTYFFVVTFMLVVLLPLLTMRSLSEERRQKTEQMLLTSSVSLSGIVLAKFLAAYVFFAVTELLSCLYFIVPYLYGAPNFAMLFGNVIAILLIGAAFIAVGIFVSSLTENQLVAAVGTIGILLVMMTVGFLTASVDNTFARLALDWISVYSRYSAFTYGQFDFAALLYYISISFDFLLVTVFIYQRRRWA